MLLAQTPTARTPWRSLSGCGRGSRRTWPSRMGREIPVTASFGVATYPETVKVRDQLFPAADKALYIAKHDGRNCVRAKPATKGRATG